MYHQTTVLTQGHYWRINACFDTDEPKACATDLVIYGVHKSEPKFTSLISGFFGLSPSRGIGNSSQMNLFEQIYDRGMISKKMFGVHTHMYNSTEDPSSYDSVAMTNLYLKKDINKHGWTQRDL